MQQERSFDHGIRATRGRASTACAPGLADGFKVRALQCSRGEPRGINFRDYGLDATTCKLQELNTELKIEVIDIQVRYTTQERYRGAVGFKIYFRFTVGTRAMYT